MTQPAKRDEKMMFIDIGFYPIYLEKGHRTEREAALNPGTIRVENIEGQILWPISH